MSKLKFPHRRPMPWPDDGGPVRGPLYYFGADCDCAVCSEQRSQAQQSQVLAIERLGRHLAKHIRSGDRRNYRIASQGAQQALALWPALLPTELH